MNKYGIRARPGDPVSYGSTPDITGMPGIHIECKRNERLNIHDAMKQADRDAEKFKDGLPAVFHRKNRTPWLITLKLTDFMEVYNAWQEILRN